MTGWAVVDSEIARDYFVRYGVATIVLGRFFTSVRAIAWPAAAAHGVGYPMFLMLDIAAAGLWALCVRALRGAEPKLEAW